MPETFSLRNTATAQWSPNGRAEDLSVPTNQLFGRNVFSPAVQRQLLPRSVYGRLNDAIAGGEPLDASLADTVASAMRE